MAENEMGPEGSASKISKGRLAKAKRAFVTRRAVLDGDVFLNETRAPRSGDLCLARISRIGHHRKLELVTGRRATLYVGDEVIVAFADRYATDQFCAEVPKALQPCHLVAAGGIASEMISKHSKTRLPTRIEPVGLLCHADGRVMNLKDYAIGSVGTVEPLGANGPRPSLMAVFGCGMNAGKTTTVSNVVRSLSANHLRAAAIKLTGTGAGGDMWQYLDAGASALFDFTDAGYASTVGLDESQLNQILRSLYVAAAAHADVVVAEIADGLYQPETDILLNSEFFKAQVDNVLFAAANPMSAVAGVEHLTRLGYDVSAVSGAISASDLAVKELESVARFEVLPTARFENDDRIISILLQRAARRPEQVG